MTTDVHVTNLSPDASNAGDGHTLNDFNRRLHHAAALIANSPPPGQRIFKFVTSELCGHNVPGAEAVKQGIEAKSLRSPPRCRIWSTDA
jgi:hypothetical protein